MAAVHSFEKENPSLLLKATKDSKNDHSVLLGKTADGKVFPVPKTSDMITNLFFTTRRRTLIAYMTLAILGAEIALFFALSSNFRRYFFLGLFILWRMGYNGFLGYLLQKQSNRSHVVKALMRGGWLDDKSPRGKWIKSQLSGAMHTDYDFDAMPPEFNAWLIFRELVDLILANDFGCYLLFALSHFQLHSEWAWWENVLRFLVAGMLIAFNVAVKIDALRVVKDFAWYWGDFFFLIEQSLTFDGVFELAPHPMYSVGYAGYYGISLLTGNTTVFYVSLLAHAAQFLFLVVVENPHIEKTYPSDNAPPATPDVHSVYHPRNLALFDRPDLHRATGFLGVVVMGYGIVLPLLSILQARLFVSQRFLGILVLGHALMWRLIQTLGLGFLVLQPQSIGKAWTRHFIKTGGTSEEAFLNWRQIYSIVSIMSYISFLGAAAYYYQSTSSWAIGGMAMRHTFGILLVALHVWTTTSILEVVGGFGWFYGDFFLDPKPAALRYTGIYRYLNNPENILGQAALYGIALMSASRSIFFLALASHLAYLVFHYGVEAPHMQSRYGSRLRKEAGVSKTVRGAARSLTASLAGARALDAIKRAEVLVDLVGQRLDGAFGGATARIPSIVSETNGILSSSKIKLAETRNRLIQDLVEGSFSPEATSGYCLLLLGLPEAEPARFQMGQPIRVQVAVPAGRRWDWVGIYPVISNPSKSVTTVASKGRYLFTLPPSQNHMELPQETDEDDETPPERSEGEEHFYSEYQPKEDGHGYYVTLTFSGTRLPWKPGTYELRCHQGQGYNVTCISRPLEISSPLPPPRSPTTAKEVASLLLPYVARCIDLDPSLDVDNAQIPPLTLVEASKIATVIKALFQVEFVPQVVLLHIDIIGLSQRIIDAREALAPFSIVCPQASSETVP
ncbi:phosphatidylethanolamine N-methyltransferase [Entomophthora muscae]|uniref:Phosphatidylethanolamine N-methyltransferase n=1 Tax=Entomophthora muscae TaxID=34485 RepID=A0ACC2T1P3_9FUNG|nr:phosphatidylethanolamine N-methyltransferase [Entomophthora muscae]